MPARSDEEKARRKSEYLERVAIRKATRLAVATNAEGTTPIPTPHPNHTTSSTTLSQTRIRFSHLPEDIIQIIFCYLPAKDLGSLTLTCKTLNQMIFEARIPHVLSRLNHHSSSCENTHNRWSLPGQSNVAIQLCNDPTEARLLLQNLNENSPTQYIYNEYISYARFIEEAISGYAILSKLDDNHKPFILPPCVQGRFASVSPEHSICRMGGDGSTGGGSGIATWGAGRRGQLGHGKRQDEEVPLRLTQIGYGGIRIVQVSAGGGLVRVAHSLLLTSAGRVLSFGCAQYGALGHGYSPGKQLRDVLRPQFIQGLAHVTCTCVSAGELHSAVVTSDGDVYSWGDGFCGQLGLGDKRPQLLPRRVTLGGLEDECVLSVSCGARHTLCVTEDGEVFSFGLGHFGVLGRSYTPFQYHADRAIESFLGDERIDAIVNPPGAAAEAEAAGPPVAVDELDFLSDEMRRHLDLLGTLTLDDNSDQCMPKMMDSLKGIRMIGACAGHRHSILLDSKGGVYTCGTGALGHGNSFKQDYPMKIMEFEQKNIQIVQISAGVDTSMAISSHGEVYAWGKSSKGQIGIDSGGSEIYTPRMVSLRNKSGETIRAVDAECGYEHSIIIALDGTVYFCGRLTKDEEVASSHHGHQGQPYQLEGFKIWHRTAEFKEIKQAPKWKKYGKYEVKGRSNMMEETKKWS